MAFALFVFLPWSEELSRSVFLSSFSLTLAFNVAWWTTLAHTNSFYALFMMGINLLLTAPASVSLASLSRAKQRIEIGFGICYFMFALIKLVSFPICIYKARLYDGAGIASFRSECKEYYGIMIAMIAVSALQVAALGALSWVLYKRHRCNNRSSIFENSQVLLWVSAFPFVLAICSLILIERLESFPGLTQENLEMLSDRVTFGQVFAIAGSVGPFIEFLKYLFYRTENLNGKSPFGYVLQITHFTDRKDPHHVRYLLTHNKTYCQSSSRSTCGHLLHGSS